ncbi:MAG: hypothetical protein PUD93_00270 [Lachnospiraceae bacterium]|nr:hypothetical protein [Lachnospiraceae bacterium]
MPRSSKENGKSIWKQWFKARSAKRKVHRNTKDRIFRFLFEKDREALLQLYNALNGTDYQDALQLQIVTIESAVYIVMKNDLAYVLAGTLNMYEHQSSYNPNLPVRFLIYLAQEYQKLIEEVGISLYGTRQIVLPTPQCIVFYNGEKEMPEEQILRLSDAFENKEHKADVELTVRMLNINYGYNRELMEKCKILEEYAEFVSVSRKFAEQENDKKVALNKAIDYCIENEILRDFLKKYRAEVLGMLLEEFDAEKYEKTIREEGRKEGQYCAIIEILQEMNQSKEFVKNKLMEKYVLTEKEADEIVRRFWKE